MLTFEESVNKEKIFRLHMDYPVVQLWMLRNRVNVKIRYMKQTRAFASFFTLPIVAACVKWLGHNAIRRILLQRL